MDECIDFLKGISVIILIICLILVAILGLYCVVELMPVRAESGAILIQYPRHDGNCSIGYARADGSRDRADVWLQDCPIVQVGMYCTFRVSFTKTATDIQCKAR